jgi:hypothetical protein
MHLPENNFYENTLNVINKIIFTTYTFKYENLLSVPTVCFFLWHLCSGEKIYNGQGGEE